MNSMRRYVIGGMLLGVVASANAINFSFSHTWSANDPQMANRLFRNGVPSAYPVLKAFPGTLAGPVWFSTLTVTNPFNKLARLDTRTTQTGTFISSFTAAYVTLFNPAVLATNYLGDEGSSPAAATGSFTSMSCPVPALTSVVIMVASLNVTTNLGGSFRVDGTLVSVVPEPVSMVVFGVGAIGLLARRRRK